MVSVVIPNWNGKDVLKPCLDSLLAQTAKPQIIVVDNGSTDGSVDFIKQNYPKVVLVELDKNYGFAGGVNAGIKKALNEGADYIALFNNDAQAKPTWLTNLIKRLKEDNQFGIVTGKLVRQDGQHLDSTGEFYSIWGMPFPRGRNEVDRGQYDSQTNIFAATGGASLYRTEMLNRIGLFDEDFFAYFEDVDISFRAQLAGWKVAYEPSAIAYHQVGATSSKLAGFTTYHSAKNFLLLYAKNMPLKLYLKYLPFFSIWFLRWCISSTLRGKFVPFWQGVLKAISLHLSTSKKRRLIQSNRKVSVDYINKMLYHHRPPKPPKMESS